MTKREAKKAAVDAVREIIHRLQAVGGGGTCAIVRLIDDRLDSYVGGSYSCPSPPVVFTDVYVADRFWWDTWRDNESIRDDIGTVKDRVLLDRVINEAFDDEGLRAEIEQQVDRHWTKLKSAAV